MWRCATVDIGVVALRSRTAFRRLGFWLPSAALALTLLAIGLPPIRAVVLSLEEAPPVRGERLAGELGCFGCHGPAGQGGVQNQKARIPVVPGFTGDRGLIHSKTREDLRAFIVEGAPRWRQRDPEHEYDRQWAALKMPAYGEILDDSETEDLVAYIWLASQRGRLVPDDPLARRGAAVAEAQGCFHCHGPLGVGGQPNPGSLKGYIPGFWGEDFTELVRNDEELRGWIEAGQIERIAADPIGKRFFQRQRVVMPPFGQFLAPEEIDALIAYVRWLRAEVPPRFTSSPEA